MCDGLDVDQSQSPRGGPSERRDGSKWVWVPLLRDHCMAASDSWVSKPGLKKGGNGALLQGGGDCEGSVEEKSLKSA